MSRLILRGIPVGLLVGGLALLPSCAYAIGAGAGLFLCGMTDHVPPPGAVAGESLTQWGEDGALVYLRLPLPVRLALRTDG